MADVDAEALGLDDRVRLVLVESPDAAGPLVSALDVAGAGAWMWVESDHALYYSRRVLDLLGLTPHPVADLLDRFLASVHEDDRAPLLELLHRTAQAGAFIVRCRVTPAGGPLRWVEVRGRVERSASGVVSRQGGTVRDITDDWGRELERREGAARLEALVNAMPFSVWGRTGSTLVVSHQNSASIGAWGDLRGSSLNDAPADVRDLWQAQIAEVMTGQVVRQHLTRVHDGEPRVFQDIIAPVIVDDRVSGVVGVAIDVTDEEQARERARDATRHESLGVLAGGIAHDFNNLLTSILGHSSLLRMEFGTTPAIASALDHIDTAGRRAADLCRQMLSYAGRGRFTLRPVVVNDLVRDVKRVMAPSLPPGATLQVHMGAHVPGVLADEPQVRQLVTDLVINASEALVDGHGRITVRTSCRARTTKELADAVCGHGLPPGRYVAISVTDTGEGMSADTRSRIFDPFFSTRFTGRGLGLATAIGIMRAHKGALRVESELGAGSTFEILLPASDEPAPRPRLRGSVAGDYASATLRGTALIVDDEPSVRALAQRILERAGMDVLTAENGRDGVDLFRAHADEVSLVVVDMTMPGLSGRDTLAAIRAIRAEVPAIVMSGFHDGPRPDDLPHEFLQKPFTPAALRALAKRILVG